MESPRAEQITDVPNVHDGHRTSGLAFSRTTIAFMPGYVSIAARKPKDGRRHSSRSRLAANAPGYPFGYPCTCASRCGLFVLSGFRTAGTHHSRTVSWRTPGVWWRWTASCSLPEDDLASHCR